MALEFARNADGRGEEYLVHARNKHCVTCVGTITYLPHFQVYSAVYASSTESYLNVCCHRSLAAAKKWIRTEHRKMTKKGV